MASSIAPWIAPSLATSITRSVAHSIAQSNVRELTMFVVAIEINAQLNGDKFLLVGDGIYNAKENDSIPLEFKGQAKLRGKVKNDIFNSMKVIY